MTLTACETDLSMSDSSKERESLREKTNVKPLRFRAFVDFLHCKWPVIALALEALALGISFLFSNHRAFRALDMCLSFGGQTWFTIILSLVAPIAGIWKEKREEGFLAMMKNGAARCAGVGLSLFGAAWVLLFVVNMIFIGDETFSVSDIAEYAEGVSVALNDKASDDDDLFSIPQWSGFWANQGCLLTCFKTEPARLTVLKPIPPILTGNFIITSSVGLSPGQQLHYDSGDGLTIVYDTQNPFQSEYIPMTGIVNHGSSINNMTVYLEKFWVPVFSRNQLKVGTKLIACPISIQDGKAVLKAIVGTVTNPWYAEGGPRIDTDIPFKENYLGAPVFDETKEVVGMISDETDSMCVLIPSETLISEMEHVHPSGP